MAINSGLVALRSGIQSYFTSRGVTANVSLGWRQAAKQINQGTGRANRVVLIPSDPSGKGGKLVGTQQPGQRTFGSDTSARALFDWQRQITVSVWAADLSAPHDEEKQIEAVEDLFEWVVRACQFVARNNAQWGEVSWVVSPIETGFGKELRASLTFRHPLFDTESSVVYPAAAISKV